MIKLLVKFEGESKEVEFSEAEISIGRATDNVLPIPDKKSSRKHAKIEKINGEYLVNDLGSGNGTKVNGKKIDFQALNKGDEIAIGDARLTLKAIDDGPDALEADDEIKISDDTDDKLDLVDEPETETEKIEWSEAETEVQAPAVKKPTLAAKPAPKGLPGKPGLAKHAAAPAKPGLKRPLGPGKK